MTDSTNFTSVMVPDRTTSTLLLQAKVLNGLYSFSLPPIRSSSQPYALFGATTSADHWHARLGHPSSTTTLHVLQTFSLPCSSNKLSMCHDCVLAKCHKLPFNSSTSSSSSPLELIHSDVWGPSPLLSSNGYRYFVIFVDDFTRFSWIYFLHSKDEVPTVFSLFKSQIENLLNTTIKILRTDGGTEFKPIARLFPHILHQTSCPYTPQQNGVAERKHRHIIELSLAIINHASIPLQYWDEIFANSVYLINRLPSSTSSNSPYKLLFHHDPDYTHLRILGCACFPLTKPYNDHKLQNRSLPCVLLGYAFSQKGYKCLHLPTNKIYISRHVIFDESTFPFKTLSASQSEPTDSSPLINSDLWLPNPLPSHFTFPQPNHEARPVTSTSPSQPTSPSNQAASSSSPLRADHTASTSSPFLLQAETSSIDFPISQPTTTLQTPAPVTFSSTEPTHPSHHMVTRTRDQTRRPKLFPDHVAYISTSSAETDPTTFNQAQQFLHWREAMAQEITALANNNTWVLVPPPADQHIIGCKWVYRTKRHANGSIERYKARLVAKGYNQLEGIDYFDTYSPVVRPTTIRLVLSLALTRGWPLRQLDVQNAFLHGDLNETVYMNQPPGFIDPTYPNHVCLLSKSLYGLKQSPRAWFQTLSSALLKIGFTSSRHDPSLFILHSNGRTIILLVYVDDIVVTGSHPDFIHEVISTLQHRFALKDLGSLHYFLGIEVLTSPLGIHLSQKKYITDLLHKANMTSSKPCSSPMVAHPPLSKTDGDPLEDPHLYRTIVGALQYATITRPDVAFAVNKVSQFMHNPTSSHWAAVKRILRYLNGTLSHGLHFQPGSNLTLHAYSDADWAGCPDDRKSTSGFCIFLGSHLISWSAKKQPTVSRSSTEAEYRSLALASAELCWIQFLLHELGVTSSSPPILWCDNIGATFLASNPMFHSRTKHVEIDYHFVRDRVSSGKLLIQYICSKDQLADSFTKPLTTPRFIFLRDKLTVSMPPSS